MDKVIVFSVAGSGKSTKIIDYIEGDSRSIVITYTENNAISLKKRIVRKFGTMPEGVRVYTYFTFLYSFCFRPLALFRSKGLCFEQQLPAYSARALKTHLFHFMNKSDRLYHNRLAKIFSQYNCTEEVNERIGKFFDTVYIDEFQDFSANDFNFICGMADANFNMFLVGDFFQHTFDTSRDGSVRKNLFADYDKYCALLENYGFVLNRDMLTHSYRCSPTICSFVAEKLGIEIFSHREDEVEIKELECTEEINSVWCNDEIVKLFYNGSNKYRGNVNNWGAVKGLDDFEDVCVVLNPKTYQSYKSNNLLELPPNTKNKLYVACTRARGNLYFIEQNKLNDYRAK